MKGKVLFVVPEFDIKTPRTIRTENIVKNFKKDDYLIAKFNLNNSKDDQFVLIKPSWLARIYYRYRIRGIFRRLDSNFLDNLTPLIGIITRNILSLVKQNNISTVVIVSAPFSLFKLSKFIRKEFPDLSIIYDIGDPFFYNSTKRGRLTEEDKKEIEESMLENSNGIIVTNNETKEMYHSFYNFPLNRIAVIPQGVNLKMIKSIKKSQSLRKSDKIKIIYSGIFYPGLRDPYNFFNAIEKYGKIEVDIYGSNLSLDYKNIKFRNRLDQKKLFKKINDSDIILFIDNDKGIQTPGKIYEVLAFKKNILFIYSDQKSSTYKFAKGLNSNNLIFVKNVEAEILKSLRKLKINEQRNIAYSSNDFSWKKRSEVYSCFINERNI